MSFPLASGAPALSSGRTASFAERSRIDRARPQFGSEFVRAASILLRVGAEEELQQAQSSAGAWVHRLTGSGSESLQAWQSYRSQLNQSLDSENLRMSDLHRVALQSPAEHDSVFGQLTSILAETNPEFMATSLLSLAEDCLQRGDHPRLAETLLTMAADNPATRDRAFEVARIASGGGSFAQQLEFQAPQLLRNLASPLMLGSFGLANLASRSASLLVLARSTRLTLGTLVASEGAALLSEVPALVLSRRIGEQLFVGGHNLLAPQSLGHEMLTALGPFALLRGTSNVFGATAPALRQFSAFRNSVGEFNGLGSAFTQSAQFGSEVFAVMLGNSLNAYAGLTPPVHSTSENFIQGLLTVGHMRIASHILDSSGAFKISDQLAMQRGLLIGQRFDAFLDQTGWAQGNPLRARASSELQRAFSDGQFQPFTLESWIGMAKSGRFGELSGKTDSRNMPTLAARFESLAPRNWGKGNSDLDDGSGLAFAGYAASRPPSEEEPLFVPRFYSMGSGGNDEGGDGKDGKPPVDSSAKPEGPSQSRMVLHLLGERLRQYSTDESNQKNLLLAPARGLKALLDRMSSNPELTKDPLFAERLAEIEDGLRKAGETQGKMKTLVETLKVLIRRSPPEVVKPEAAQTQQNQLDLQQEERESIARNLWSLHGILQKARDSGWSDSLRSRLAETVSRLNSLFKGGVWKIPGTEAWRNARATEAGQLSSRHGAILGMVQGGMNGRVDSLVARDLRGESTSREQPDLELELLHRSILAVAQQKPNEGKILKDIDAIASEYHAGAESKAAMRLLAISLQRLIARETPPEELLEFLQSHESSVPLRDHFLLLKSISEGEAPVGEGLDLIGVEPLAADYFASGMHAFLMARDSAESLQNWNLAGQGEGIRGFHASISNALFGAAHGLEKVPRLVEEPKVDEIIEKAMKGD